MRTFLLSLQEVELSAEPDRAVVPKLTVWAPFLLYRSATLALFEAIDMLII